MPTITIELSAEELDDLRVTAAEQGVSEAEVVRAALGRYRRRRFPFRYSVLSGSAEGDGTSAADIPEEEYLKGFGES
jgi:hypothetical protein